MCAQSRYFWDWSNLGEDLSSKDSEQVGKHVMLDFIRSHSIR
jgi:hypothetical protein